MGAYLSSPVTETAREDGESRELRYGASSMQGWRVSQEDAHIAIVDYDAQTSLFAVFDGHGGAEVAQYSAQRLPHFIKSLSSYQKHNLSEALEEAFLQFDSTLVEPEVVHELKVLAGSDDMDREDEEGDEDEASLLRQEADIPIEDLMARYNRSPVVVEDNEVECSSSSNVKQRIALPLHLRQEMSNTNKPLSPYLRAKNYKRSEREEEMCSSSTGGSTSAVVDDISNCDSNYVSQPDSTNKIDSESINEATAKSEDHDKSKQIANGESNSMALNSSDVCHSSRPFVGDESPDNVNEITTSNVDLIEKISDKNDNNNDINSSSHSFTNADTSHNNVDSISDEVSSAVSTVSSVTSKGKGKQKKATPLKRKCTTSMNVTEEDSGPIYKSFLRDFDESEESDDSHDDYTLDLSEDDDDDNDDDLEDDDDDEETSEEEEEELDDTGFIVQSSGGYEEPGRDSGCTAVLALLRSNKLYVANAGDSRCVVSKDGKAFDMSVDHKPEDEVERIRVEKAGGKVTPDGRVNGGLNLSRAIGDHAYKDNHNLTAREQMITALPDVKTLNLDFSTDRFMVLACDGIWNSLSSQQVIDFIEERIYKTEKLSAICDDLFNHCLAANTMGDGTGCDNMTCIIVKFNETTAKRKIEENNMDGSHVDTSVTNEQPDSKRLKSDNCENEREINSTETLV